MQIIEAIKNTHFPDTPDNWSNFAFNKNINLLEFYTFSCRGFFRSDVLVGTVNVKLQPLETQCELHESFEVSFLYKKKYNSQMCKIAQQSSWFKCLLFHFSLVSGISSTVTELQNNEVITFICIILYIFKNRCFFSSWKVDEKLEENWKCK